MSIGLKAYMDKQAICYLHVETFSLERQIKSWDWKDESQARVKSRPDPFFFLLLLILSI